MMGLSDICDGTVYLVNKFNDDEDGLVAERERKPLI